MDVDHHSPYPKTAVGSSWHTVHPLKNFWSVSCFSTPTATVLSFVDISGSSLSHICYFQCFWINAVDIVSKKLPSKKLREIWSTQSKIRAPTLNVQCDSIANKFWGSCKTAEKLKQTMPLICFSCIVLELGKLLSTMKINSSVERSKAIG